MDPIRESGEDRSAGIPSVRYEISLCPFFVTDRGTNLSSEHPRAIRQKCRRLRLLPERMLQPIVVFLLDC